MTEVIRFALIGLGIGALYGLIAQGLVLVYRGSGILNFAQGAFVLVGAYAYYEFSVEHGLPLWVSIGLAMVAGAVVGALTQLVILRPMRQASPLTRVVATLGILVVIQSSAVLRYGVDIKSVPSLLPTRRVEFIGGAPVGLDRMLLLAVGLAGVVVLYAVYRYTGFGRVTSAVAENQRAAASLGHSPDVIATGNWALGGALAGLAGALIAPITFLQPTQLVLLVVPALAAGLIGGFSSFPIAFAGALAIGVGESWMQRYVRTPGFATSVPFAIVIGVLVIRGRGLPLRSHVLDRLPVLGSGRVRPIPVATVFAVMTIVLLWWFPVRWVDAFTVTMTFAVLCLSVVAVTGLAGQLSLTQYVIAGVGALVAARLAESWGWPFPFAIAGAAVVAVALGAVVALPALRTRGINLAIVTFGMATVIYSLVLNNSDYTGGTTGISVPSPTVFGWDINPIRHPERYAVVVLVLLFVAGLMLCNVRRGAAGRRLIAVRSNERAAAAVGVNVYVAKLYAFALASALASVAGVLAAFRQSNVIAGHFEVFPSINIVGMTVAGGVGSVGGGVLGATLLQGGVGSELLRSLHGLERYLPLIGGLFLLQILRTDQNGLLSMNVHLAKAIAAKVRRRRPAADARRRRPAGAAESSPGPVESSAPPGLGASRIEGRTLKVEGMVVRFGGVTAVDDLSIEVRPGEIHGLIGPNGAGKTTTVDGITGFVRPRSGRITIDGGEIGTLSVRRRSRAGMSRSFQSLELFDDLTVRENLAVACDGGELWRYLTDLVRPGRIRLTPVAEAVISEFGLAAVLDLKPPELPYGSRRLVGIARAIAAGPSVVLLDEPAAGLSDVESAELATVIRSLAHQRGMAVLLIEHNIDLVLAVCDRVTVMTTGRVLVSDRPEHVRRHPAVLEAYLGEDGTDPEPASDVLVSAVS